MMVSRELLRSCARARKRVWTSGESLGGIGIADRFELVVGFPASRIVRLSSPRGLSTSAGMRSKGSGWNRKQKGPEALRRLTQVGDYKKIEVWRGTEVPPGAPAQLPKWRNWQTRMVQVHVPARVWGFESLLRHHLFPLNDFSRQKCGSISLITQIRS